MKLTRLSPDSDVEVLRLSAREVVTLARAVVLVDGLVTLRYPGSGDVLAWLKTLQDDATPLRKGS